MRFSFLPRQLMNASAEPVEGTVSIAVQIVTTGNGSQLQEASQLRVNADRHSPG